LSEIANNSTKALQSALEEIEKLKERIEVLES
jgi:archaellum component FlaC